MTAAAPKARLGRGQAQAGVQPMVGRSSARRQPRPAACRARALACQSLCPRLGHASAPKQQQQAQSLRQAGSSYAGHAQWGRPPAQRRARRRARAHDGAHDARHGRAGRGHSRPSTARITSPARRPARAATELAATSGTCALYRIYRRPPAARGPPRRCRTRCLLRLAPTLAPSLVRQLALLFFCMRGTAGDRREAPRAAASRPSCSSMRM